MLDYLIIIKRARESEQSQRAQSVEVIIKIMSFSCFYFRLNRLLFHPEYLHR